MKKGRFLLVSFLIYMAVLFCFFYPYSKDLILALTGHGSSLERTYIVLYDYTDPTIPYYQMSP